MGDKKKHKDKKDKKKNKDKDRQRRDKKKKEKKRSYSSSSSSDSSSDSSSQSRERSRKKDSKKIKKQKKQVKSETKVVNPYDFDSKATPKAMSTFPMGPMSIPTPGGFSLPPIIHATPPPPTAPSTIQVQKPKTKQINIFKLLPKLPYGVISFAKIVYSTQYIQQKAYNILLQQMMNQIQQKVKQENHKKAISIIGKCKVQIKRQIQLQEQQKAKQSNEEISDIYNDPQLFKNQQSNRFLQLKKVYEGYFGKQ